MCTQVNTLRKKPAEVTHSLFETIMGITVAPPTKAMKHGIALEPHTKKKYVSEFKRTHLNFNRKDIGLVLFKKHPNLGASLDFIVECRCCGKVLLKLIS